MRFFVQTQDLNAATSTVIKAVSVKNTLQILEGILIEATKDGIRLKCSDLSLQIETTIPAAIEEEGAIVVPGRLFSDMTRRLPAETVEITCAENTVTIQCGRFNTTLQGMPASDFPDMPRIEGGLEVQLTQRKVRDIVRQTIFATAQDDTKPILTGLLVEFEQDRIIAVALDGYRLALRRESCVLNATDQKAVLPAKSMLEISRILQGDDDPIKITFAKTHVLFDMEHTRIVTRLLDGEFIRYRQILPSESNTRVRLNRTELLNSIDRASLMAREDKSNLVKMEFARETLHISANSEMGRLNEEIQVALTGAEIKIAFNAKYFTDVLKALEDEELYLDMNNSISPCVVKPVQGDSFYYLILPMRIFGS